MSRTIEGVVGIVQEGRFMLTDTHGVGHLFMLGANAGADTSQLAGLWGVRVRVRYRPGEDIVGHVATSLARVG